MAVRRALVLAVLCGSVLAGLYAVPVQAAPAAPAALCTVTLQQGSTGPCVATLQRRLNALGLRYPLAVDGNFGPLTRNAVEAFQGRSSITVDGIVGPVTRSHLESPGGVDLTSWTVSQVQAEIRAVFPASAEATALRVANCESGDYEIAINRNSNGTRDFGVFQLNDGGTLQSVGGTRRSALHAASNIQLAYQLYRQYGWTPWNSSRSCWG